jgi:hypothetical protein
LVKQFVADYNIKRVVISLYNAKANGIIERDHKFIVDILAKMIKEGISKWIRNLHAVFWANKIIIRKSIGYISFCLNIGMEAILLIEFDILI